MSFVYYILRLFSFVLCLLPRLFVEKIALFFAGLSFYVFRIRKSVMLKNLNLVYGDTLGREEKQRVMWECTKCFFFTVFECLYSPRLSLTSHAELPDFEGGLDKIDLSKGAFVVVGHMSNWEATGALVNKMIEPSYAVVKKVGGDQVHRFVSFLRQTNRFNTIEVYSKGRGKNSGSVVRGIFKRLSEGRLVGFPMDQYRPGDIEVPFFNHATPTNSMLANLWLRKKVPVFGAYSIRQEFGRHRLYLTPQVDLDPSWTKEDIPQITKKFNGIMESIVLNCPDQYFWFHRRWKNLD